MPIAKIRGININYEVIGATGPWVALSPGGRSGLGNMRSMAEKIAAGGNRVLIHDRRNCGKSDVVIDDSQTEYEAWADDLFELLTSLKGAPAFIGGSSSGCRLSLIFALRHPKAVSGLMLWRLSGGERAVKRLSHKYHGEYIEAMQKGGMQAVCDTEFFKERIKANPANRDYLMGMDPKRFLGVMTNWKARFDEGTTQPVIGASESDLKSINLPTIIIPGNDQTHRREVGREVHGMIANSELREMSGETLDREVVPPKEWVKEEDLAVVLNDFIARVQSKVAA